MASPDPDPLGIAALIEAGSRAFTAFQSSQPGPWFPFAPSDHEGAAALLEQLRPEVDHFVELGAGVGVVTICADLLGMEAVGIECQPALIDAAETLALAHGSGASFVEGSFFPADFLAATESAAEDLPTLGRGRDAWAELGMELRDFDLIYSFHWPGLEELFAELIQEHARPGALFLTYGATESFRLFRDGEELPLPR